MFYEIEKNNHGLKYNPYKSCVVPRPIAWVSTVSARGTANLAPFSQFTNLAYDPPFVLFSAGMRPDDGRSKDSAVNAQETGEFVINIATWELRDYVNKTAQVFPENVDEFEAVGLTKAPSRLVKVPRLAESPINIECQYYSTITLPAKSIGSISNIIIGKVLAVHIDNKYITDDKVNIKKLRPLARLGYLDYTSVENVFEMPMSGDVSENARRAHMGEVFNKGEYNDN